METSSAAITDALIEWRIPGFFPHQKKNEYASPKFAYFGAQRQIMLRKRGDFWEMEISKERFDYYPITMAHYTMGIKKIDGTVYKSASGKLYCNASDQPFATNKFLSLMELQRDTMDLASQDALVAFCIFSLQENHFQGKVTATRTLDACTETTDEDFQKIIGKLDGEEEPLLSSSGVFKLSQDVKNLFLNGKDCDTTITVGDREFRAHRLILGARSAVFSSMYSHDTSERNTGIVEIEDCSPDVFQDFLTFLYSGRLESLASENAPGLYAVADKYDVEEVKQECLKFMISNLSVENFCAIICLALKYSEQNLLKSAADYFVKNARKICVTPKWLSFHKNYPTESNELHIKALERYAPE